jgi:hypothetical protein
MNKLIKAKNFIKRNEKYVIPTALFGGFIIDSLTLQRIDLLFENLVLGTYLVLSGVLVFLIYLLDKDKLQNRFLLKIQPFLGVILLFVFGGIFSGFTVFYLRSSNILSSWPFLLLLIVVMLGTEYLKKHFSKAVAQITIFYFALYTYLIFVIPIITKQLGIAMFLLSGIVSLGLFYLYTKLFNKFIKNKFQLIKKQVWISVGTLFAIINIFYFADIIPPIPLSIKEADVYHYVERVGGNYNVLEEDENIFEKLWPGNIVQIERGDSLYLFSSIFAPTNLSTKVIHEWQFKDSNNKWKTASEIPFSIYGGADNGYRGYSVKSNLSEGDWRVNIKIPTGQIVARENFEIEFVENTPTLISGVK